MAYKRREEVVKASRPLTTSHDLSRPLTTTTLDRDSLDSYDGLTDGQLPDSWTDGKLVHEVAIHVVQLVDSNDTRHSAVFTRSRLDTASNLRVVSPRLLYNDSNTLSALSSRRYTVPQYVPPAVSRDHSSSSIKLCSYIRRLSTISPGHSTPVPVRSL